MTESDQTLVDAQHRAHMQRADTVRQSFVFDLLTDRLAVQEASSRQICGWPRSQPISKRLTSPTREQQADYGKSGIVDDDGGTNIR